MEGILPGQPGRIICGQDVCYLRFTTLAPSVTEKSSLSDMGQTGSKHAAGQPVNQFMPIILWKYLGSLYSPFCGYKLNQNMAGQRTHLKHLVHKYFCPESPSILTKSQRYTFRHVKKIIWERNRFVMFCVHVTLCGKIFVKFQTCYFYLNLTKHSNSVTSRQDFNM
jgi:hypothetical protein